MRILGAIFNWTNKHIWSKIDRAIINMDFYSLYDFVQAEFMNTRLSNHTPILLAFSYSPNGSSPFIFYDMWVYDA